MSAAPDRFVGLFTGQGSQFAGMGKDLFDLGGVARETFEEGERCMPGLLELCFEGPDEALVLTENTQPTVLLVDVAAYRAFGREPVAVAGHSLGEYAALVAAGSLSLADALPLVRARAEAMQAAVPAGTGGMVALRKVGVDKAKELASSIESGVCDLANFNTPAQIVLSGSKRAMDEVVEKLGPRKAIALAVSVPFHSTMLREAGAEFAKRRDAVSFADPSFPIWCNVDAKAVNDASAIRDALKRQFAGSVLWQQSIEGLLAAGERHFVEFGPKPVLARMNAQIAGDLAGELETRTISTAKDLEV